MIKQNYFEDEEKFYPIPNFEDYWINPKGEIKKFRLNGTFFFLKPSMSNSYPRVKITKKVNNKEKQFNFFIHRLVASMFVENPKPRKKKLVNHKDLNKLNYHYSNLEWVSPSENNIHYHKNKRENIGKENKENQLQ